MSLGFNFGHSTKASEVANVFADRIKGRIIAITGVSRSGLGGAAARALADHDPELLILVSRTQSKLDEVIADIKAVKPHVNVKSVLVDLISQVSVRKAAEEIKALAPRLDILINNAGLTVFERKYSPEGVETQLAANHLGPFLLTNLLKDRLLAAAKNSLPGATRIINVASETHRACPFRFHDYNSEGKPIPPEEVGSVHLWPSAFQRIEDGYMGFQTYSHTKTANILFTVGLNKRLAGAGILSYTLHPGTIATEMGRDMPSDVQSQLGEILAQFKPKPSTEEGSSTTLVAALHPALNEMSEGKLYLEDCQFANPEPYAVDSEKADKLWVLSEELVG
ncbi:hypothetical protein B0J12DRAFT_603545 [Macrophomina phaseolina]|nr:hypothetical protein B0J12DRAFT_603545 [Macrophomina phaseolina]